MATEADGEINGCTFQWKIENVSNWWWLIKGERIESPAFSIDELKGTKWLLLLYPMGNTEDNYIGFFLQRDDGGPDVIEVSYQLAFLSKDGLILTKANFSKGFNKDNINWGLPQFEKRKRVFVTEKKAFIYEDTLIVQCTINTIERKPAIPNYVLTKTVIKVKRKSFMWIIDKISSLKSQIKKFEDNLICLDLVSNDGFDKLDMYLTPFDDSIKYISCSISITDCKGRKENLGIEKYFFGNLQSKLISSTLLFSEVLREDKSNYFPNDVLSLSFEFVTSTVEHIGCKRNSVKLNNEEVGKEKYRNATNLNDDLKSMYIDGVFSDTELRTSTKSYPVHKSILSSRSPVFRSMFSNNMEKNGGHVDITDFEDDTIHTMLLYIYTDSLEDLQFQSAYNLYKIADKYQILSMKSRCSSFLKENLSPNIACGVLDLADQYCDDDLMIAVQDYILGQSKKFFRSQEWEDFMSTHLKLAAEIMHKRLTKNKMDLP